MKPPRVYAAHPMRCYGTDYARLCIGGIGQAVPGCEVIDPEVIAWADEDAWHAEWPLILATLSGLVVFAAEDGTIGGGVVREIGDALDADLQFAAYDPGLGLVELADIDWLPEARWSMRRIGSLVFGDPIPAAWLTDTRKGP